MTRRIRAALAALALVVPGPLAATASQGYRRTVAEIMVNAESERSATALRLPVRTLSRERLAANAASPRAASFPEVPAPVAPPAPSAPQTLGVSFLGASLADTNAFPPDTMGAAGPTQFLVGVNGRLRTFSKATGAADGVLNTTMDAFFGSVRAGNATFGPHVRYDRLTERWIVTILADSATITNNRVLVAASDAASHGVLTNATVWTFFFFEHDLVFPAGDSNFFLDSASLGVDANALTIGGNLFDSTGVFQGTSVHIVRKGRILAGPGGDLVPAGDVQAFRNLTGLPAASGPFAPQGVDNLSDPSPTVSWIAGVDNASFGKLSFRKLTFSAPGAWPPSSISGNLALTVPATAAPLTVPHLDNDSGSPGELDAVDDRLVGASLRNGSIWTSHNVAVGSTGASPGDRDGSRWYQIDVSSGTPALVQAGTLFDAAATDPRFYWIPAIAVSGQGHAAIGASVAGATHHADAVTAGRLATDPAGTLQSPLQFTASAAAYNPAGDPGPARRWGDYSFTSVDPSDDMTMWTIQQYCDATDSYGVRVAQLLAPPPAIPVSALPSTVAAGLPSASVVLTGDTSAGRGFFDPGPGFSRRLQASVSGGVVVNGVTYTDPGTITLDLSTVGVPFGPVSVTITNPDGQSVTTASGFLTITAGGPAPTVESVTPTSGPAAGGTPLSLAGTAFVTGATVSVGGAAATGVNVGSPTSADATSPALQAGTLNDVKLQNPDTQNATLAGGWFADFLDVPQANQFHAEVEKLVRNGVAAGCGSGSFCGNAPATRGQMAALLLKAKLGAIYLPPTCTGLVFQDVLCTGQFDAWIEDLAARGITKGCSAAPALYCPTNAVTRGQMAPLLLKTSLGIAYNPPDCTGAVFGDVLCAGQFDAWIEDLASRGITTGCSAAPKLYCPGNPSTRGQMAAFLVRTFSLP